jgi:alkane 1-monooxygenase
MNRFIAISFLLGFSIPLVPLLGYFTGNYYIGWLLPLAIIPLLDLLAGPYYSVPDARQVGQLEQQLFFRLLPMLYVPLQLAVQLCGAYLVAQTDLPLAAKISLSLGIGHASGAIGITAAHELGHKKSAFERLLSKILLVSVSYGHFYIEHNRGHHVRVATFDDPATSRRDENVYAFIVRAVVGSYTHAWRLEFARLQQFNYARFGWHNQMLWFTALPMLIALTLGLALGPWGAIFFVLQSVTAFVLLEVVDYIEHYGLTRKQNPNGKFEPVGAQHAWDSSAWVTNGALFNLQRHADHHLNPSRRYQALASSPHSPQLPTGYAGMVLLALVPPLWRAVMHPRLDAYLSGPPSASHQQTGLA